MKDRRTATVFVHSNWEVVTKPCMQTTVEARGAFYYGRDSGNFGRKSNGKVRFGSFWPQHSGPRLKVVYFGRSDRSVPFHFDKQLHCPTYRYLPSKSHSSWLARCDRKMSSIFLRFSYWWKIVRSLSWQFTSFGFNFLPFQRTVYLLCFQLSVNPKV